MKERRFGWLGVGLAIAGGFLAGVLLVAVLGGAQPAYKERTLTVAARPTGTAVPTLQGERLDRALNKLERVGLKGNVVGGGLFGVLDEADWVVSTQDPSSGARLREGDTVTLRIDRG
ncbi:MAG: PASTA domain-containing protein [Solirubrobacteraceae bacterium]